MALEITARHGKALSPHGLRPADAPAWIDGIDNPYLHGLFAPVCTPTEPVPVPVVEGELPVELFGAYLRNGPNPRHEPRNRYHWFDGDGLVQGIWFEGGSARYGARFVETEGAAMEAERGEAIWPGVLGPFDFGLPLGPLKDTGNTDLICVGGEVLALWYESGRVHRLDPATLASRGHEPLPGLSWPVSAHSKVDPATGDLLVFGYGDRPPYMRYGVVRADGTVHQTEITLPGPRRPHDLGVTPNYSVLHDFPVFFSQELFERTGKRVPLFHPDVPTRFGVIPRFGVDADVRWFSFEPCYMLHVVNCWEEGDEVVMVGCRTADPSLRPDKRDGPIAAMLSGLKLRACLHEWRMNLVTGATSERQLSELNAEFPMIDERRLGRANRYTYEQVIPYEIPATFDAVVKVDVRTGATVARYDYGPGVFGSEAPFCPRPGGTAEDDGWVVSFVTDTRDWSSQCLVFDAQGIEQGPIARVALPARVPAGFHATWVPGT
jgi:carotenoid cleavage dioxygenase